MAIIGETLLTHPSQTPMPLPAVKVVSAADAHNPWLMPGCSPVSSPPPILSNTFQQNAWAPCCVPHNKEQNEWFLDFGGLRCPSEVDNLVPTVGCIVLSFNHFRLGLLPWDFEVFKGKPKFCLDFLRGCQGVSLPSKHKGSNNVSGLRDRTNKTSWFPL